MKEQVRMVVTLTAFCLVAGGLLAWTNSVTKAPIENACRAELVAALKEVLPPFDNDVVADAVTVEDNGRRWTNFVARRQGEFVGAAFECRADGYGGPIRALVGVRSDNTVYAVVILQADKETPGLGSKIKDKRFLSQFSGKSVLDRRWSAVKKDGGEIDAITGATISSRAVAQAVKTGLEVYARHFEEIRGK